MELRACGNVRERNSLEEYAALVQASEELTGGPGHQEDFSDILVMGSSKWEIWKGVLDPDLPCV